MKDTRFYKFLLSLNALLPLALLLFDWSRGRLGVNPIEFFLRATGVMALIFITLTLAVTPARRAFGLNNLIKYRRMLGLFAFFYPSVHLVTYSIFDKEFELSAIAVDIGQRPFIAVGFAAFAMLIPLAITSTNGWIKRLGGKRWARLHKLTYIIAILGVIHFWMIVKSDVFYPVLFGAAIGFLLIFRVIPKSTKHTAAGRTVKPSA